MRYREKQLNHFVKQLSIIDALDGQRTNFEFVIPLRAAGRSLLVHLEEKRKQLKLIEMSA